jgi:hypothetical protein
MPVSIVRIEETHGAEKTFVPGVHLPTEPGANTFDVDIPQAPQPLPPWMNYVPQGPKLLGVQVAAHRPGPDRLMICELNAPSYSTLSSPHHGPDYALVGNGTVSLLEAKNTYGRLVTHIDRTDVVMMYYRSLSSSTEQDHLPFRTLDISSRGKGSEPLADYDTYAVQNWDGYDALPITSEVLRAARSILKSLPSTFGDPVCSPGADGSIVFEWLNDEGPLRKLFVDIGPGKTWKAYWRLANGKTGAIPRKGVTMNTIPELQKLFETLLRG